MPQLGGRSMMHDAAEVHDVDPIGGLQGAQHVLLDEENGDSLRLEPPDGPHHVLRKLRREPLARLVEEHEARAPEKRTGDRHHLELAPGEILRASPHEVFERSEDLEHLPERPGAKSALLPRDGEVAGDAQGRKDAAVVRHPADAGAGDPVRRPACDVGAVETEASAAGRREAENGPQRRRLAGPVRAEQGDDLARAHLEREIEQDLGLPVERVDVPHLEHQASAPRLDAWTHLSARSSSGVPLAMTWPQWTTWMKSARLEHEAHVVLDDDDGHGLAGSSLIQVAQRARRVRPEPRRRLVEEEQTRLHRERHADLEGAALAVGQLGRPGVHASVETHLGKRLPRPADGPAIGAHVMERVQPAGADRGKSEQRVLERGVLVEEVHGLERARNTQAGDRPGRKAGDVLAVEEHVAAIRPVLPGEDVEARGLSGPVRPHDGRETVLLEGQRDVLEHHLAAEALVEMPGFEQRHGQPPSRRQWARAELVPRRAEPRHELLPDPRQLPRA